MEKFIVYAVGSIILGLFLAGLIYIALGGLLWLLQNPAEPSFFWIAVFTSAFSYSVVTGEKK